MSTIFLTQRRQHARPPMHMGRTLKRAIEERDAQDAKIYDFIADVLTGITTIKMPWSR
jgi:hypothetical protein